MLTYRVPPTTDLDKLRLTIGDVTWNDGPAPDRANLSDEVLTYFLDTGGDVAGAAVLAFEHLAALWISRPIFGPGELSTIHTNLYDKYMKLANEWRTRSDDPDVTGATVTVTSFTKVDGYSDTGSEYS